tara:strand:+ start:5289 stop:6071 length:783 start_codon:yes stop_codon:yes gene_type:complete
MQSNLALKQNAYRISARKEFIEQNRLRISYERKIRLQMNTFFVEVGEQARREYTEAGRLIKVGIDIQPKLSAILEPNYRAIIEEFGQRILSARKQEALFDRLIKLFLLQQGARHIEAISNTTLAMIVSVIRQSELEGLGVATTAKAIFDRMSGSFSRYRSATIARTETHSASSFANHEVNASLNIPNQVKRWVSANDDRTRAHHRAMNGTEVPLDEDFIVPYRGFEYRMGYTGDPKGGVANVINCRCVTLYVSPEDELLD